MTGPAVSEPSPSVTQSGAPAARRHVRGVGIALFVLAAVALVTPIASESAMARVGMLLLAAGLLEVYDGCRRARDADARAAWYNGASTLLIGIVVLNSTTIVAGVVIGLLAAWFLFDAGRYGWRGVAAIRRGTPLPLRAWLLPLVGNLGVAIVVLVLRERVLPLTIAITASLRILGSAWNVLASPVLASNDAGDRALVDLGLGDRPEMLVMANRLEDEEIARGGFDREWIFGFTATLFALHAGRMGFEASLLGMLSPLLAVIGDWFIAVLIASFVVVPARLTFRKVTRPLERRAWALTEGNPVSRVTRLATRTARWWLEARLRFAIRLRQARYSPRLALRRGLRTGLPAAAVIAATVPVWGMNWYFDTENWAAGVWNSWAEARTDTWREAMVRSVLASQQVGDGADAFAVTPAGVPADGDFAFIVIGDTGEGDASQQVLRDSLWQAAEQPDVKFVVISSDVVYPTGAMRNYETNFWLPFKGVRVPLYAIPGNHDWYDALEAFVATFLEPQAARLAMRARVEADERITSTTDAHIDALIARAASYGGEYGVSVAHQRAPFFQVQTDRFALVAVDTGVARRVDDAEWAWLESALEAARGKFVMAILGHPLYAGGAYLADPADDDPRGFAAIHALLRRHGATIVMAGDTHDLEYYAERPGPGAAPTMHHWVNGGGGAYLSFGTALAWPRQPAATTWAHYPGHADVARKIDASTPWWKRPAWWWTRDLGGWPFTAEWLSALFDSNEAPFFQSFVEVRVEPSVHRVRVLPWGVHGRLRWRDLDTSGDLRDAGANPNDLVEWVVPWAQ
ncbi:Calcineurin-like phosphoesterase [Luteitalea pratensis]|uniref:Calcineurin-like phosphoesterase n=1 Tax=Luteitalea pratensis TaxID=1855912 RepID=A0A143PPD6_LUTPR|nr:Calcineurin-like phosphoesterase [Luteitalea pratensis]